MSFVDVKCPNCGASIQLDASREVGYCSYCGSKVQIQKEIKRLKIDKSSDLENLIKLAEIECEMGQKHWEQLAEYSQKIIEIDANNLDGWKYKLMAAEYKVAETTQSVDDFIFIGNKLIGLDSSPSQKAFVYEEFLDTVVAILTSIPEGCNHNVDWLKDIYESEIEDNFKNATSETAKQDSATGNIVKVIAEAMDIRANVSAEAIANNGELSKLAVKVLELLVKSEEAVNQRLGVYGSCINKNEIENKWNVWLETAREGISEDMMPEELRQFHFTEKYVFNAAKDKKEKELKKSEARANSGCHWGCTSFLIFLLGGLFFHFKFGTAGLICIGIAIIGFVVSFIKFYTSNYK